jgi:FkbH-like protein
LLSIWVETCLTYNRRSKGESVRVKEAIAISATITAEPLKEFVGFWLSKIGLDADLRFAPYNQVFQSLLDSQGVVASNKAGINVLLVRLEDWGQFANSEQTENQRAHFEKLATEFASALEVAANRTSVPFVVIFCPPSAGFASALGRMELLNEIENGLKAALNGKSSIRVITSCEFLAFYGHQDYYDASGDRLGRVPYKRPFFAALGNYIVRTFHSYKRPPAKVVILDCDDTLWDGVCGERGPSGIVLDEPHLHLQRFMKAQKERGVLLCIVSKNSPEDVEAVFERRAEMPLRRNDFVASRVNWELKSANIHSLAKELQLGLDSFVFVDNNPAETAEVKANCPGVITIALPSSADEIPVFLNHVWAFDKATVTSEDRKRTQMYENNRLRNELQSKATSYADFLANLELVIDVGEVASDDVARAAQLTQRTNQFNLMTRRRTEVEVREMLDRGTHMLKVSVRDRFGDYGLVGIVTHTKKDRGLLVEDFLLSCRVLGKGVEHAMLARLGQIASAQGLEFVEIEYVATAKNQPAHNFLASFDQAYREPTQSGFICQFPSAYANQITFRPASGAPSSESEATESGSVSEGASSRPSGIAPIDYEWVALNSIDCGGVLKTLDETPRTLNSKPSSAVPRTDLERSIVGIWEKVLKISPVGIHDNYFDLGGDSLAAVRIFVQLEAVYNQQFPLVTLFEAPTVAKLAAVIQDDGWKPHWESLVPIKTSGSRPPFYCVHGVGGNILEFMDLSRYMHPEQPLYGVQSIGLKGDRERPNLTVQEMAAHYIQEVQEFQPKGPYYLGGSSFGGLVAYEMARQLTFAGQEVRLVALFDTHGPGYPKFVGARTLVKKKIDRLKYRVQLHWSNYRSTEPNQRLNYIWTKAQRWKKAIAFRMGQRVKNTYQSAHIRIQESFFPKAIRQVKETGHWAAADYVPGEYCGRVTLFRATEQPPGVVPDRMLGWASLVKGGLEIYDTPGHHGTLTRDPRARALAQQLEDTLMKAQSSSNGACIKHEIVAEAHLV